MNGALSPLPSLLTRKVNETVKPRGDFTWVGVLRLLPPGHPNIVLEDEEGAPCAPTGAHRNHGARWPP